MDRRHKNVETECVRLDVERDFQGLEITYDELADEAVKRLVNPWPGEELKTLKRVCTLHDYKPVIVSKYKDEMYQATITARTTDGKIFEISGLGFYQGSAVNQAARNAMERMLYPYYRKFISQPKIEIEN